MSHLLTKIRGNMFMNQTMWEPTLMVYDDYIVYRRRHWFVVKEVTISYKQVAQVNLSTGIFWAELEIVITGNDTRTVRVKYAPKEETKRAKKIIDQKVHMVHHQDDKMGGDNGVKSLEKSLARLTELLEKKKISKNDFTKRKRELVDNY